jgi:hypothetical protein
MLREIAAAHCAVYQKLFVVGEQRLLQAVKPVITGH